MDFREVYDVTRSVVIEYNERNKTSLVPGKFDKCKIIDATERFMIPLGGISEITIGNIIQAMRVYFKSADVQFMSNTKYHDEFYIMIPFSDFSDQRTLAHQESPSCTSTLAKLCFCILLLVTLVSVLVVVALVIDSSDPRTSAPHVKSSKGDEFLEFSTFENGNFNKAEETDDTGLLYRTGYRVARMVLKMFYLSKTHDASSGVENAQPAYKDIRDVYNSAEL